MPLVHSGRGVRAIGRERCDFYFSDELLNPLRGDHSGAEENGRGPGE